MSLLPALEETEKSAGHGWNTSNRFSMDTSSGGGKQFDYHHLISQNNTGDVPDALVEEEVIQENDAQVEVEHQLHGQQQQQLALQHHQQQQLQKQGLLVRQQQQTQQKTKQEQLLQQQFLQQKQTMLQNQKRGIQQAQNRKQPAQQKMVYTVVHSGNQQQQQVMVPNKSVRQPAPQQAGQNFLIHQGQNRPTGIQQQSLINTSCSATEEEINQKLLQTQKEIEENDKKLVSLGLQPHMKTPVISSQSDFTSQQQLLNNCDYLGSVSAKSPANQLEPGGKIRQMLTQSQGSTTQRKVDINFSDSNSGFQANSNQRVAQGVQGLKKTQVVTVSGRGQSQISHPQQRTPVKPNVIQLPVQGNQTTSASYQSPVQVQTVSTNQAQNQSAVKTTTQMQKINKNNVVLEGGGQFEEGQAYVIRDRFGNARTMLWQNGEFHPYDKDKGIMIQHSVIDSSQRGRGARGGRGRGRGRGQGHLHGNATGVHMNQNVRGSSTVVNNGVRQTQFSTTVPTNRPQLNFMRQSLMQQIRHPNNQQLRQLSTQGHVIHTSPSTQNVPIISVVTSPGLQGQVVQQRPKLPLQNLMPAAQLKMKTKEETHSESDAGTDQAEQKSNEATGSDKEHVLNPPNIPQDPSAYAVCQYCGTTSMDKYKCESCKRMFTSATKYVIPNKSGDGNPETKRRKLNTETGTVSSTITTMDKNSFYSKKLQEQNEIYVKVLNSSNNSVTGPIGRHQPRIIRQTYGRGKRGRGRGRGMFVPETVTISSDEEESNDMNKSKSHSMSAPATPIPSRSPSHAVDQPECPESPLIPTVPISFKKGDKARVKMMENAEGTSGAPCEKSPSPRELTLNARTVRVGTFRGAPVEPILVSNNGLSFFIEGVTGTHTFQIYPQEIQQCLTKFEGETNLIFFLTTQNCAVRTRKDLGMVVIADPTKPPPEHYFDPLGSDTRHQMITIVMDQLPVETRLDFQKYMELFKSWGKQGDEAFFMELSKVEADEIFRLSSSTHRVQQGMTKVADHGYSQAEEDRQSDRSPSPKIGFVGPIIKLLTYPPPPAKGGISITNEDLYCLQEGEFLNDVIVDFYLKYLLHEKLSEADQARTHIFSSFFYKRLTQRIRGAAIDDDPNVTLPVKRHARVKTWTRKLDLFEKDFIVIPINEHAHWFLAIICFPGLEKPVEVPYIPIPITTPQIDPSSCPTPPQPTDDGGEDMDAEDNEDPLSDVTSSNTEAGNLAVTDNTNGGTAAQLNREKVKTETQSDLAADSSQLENQFDQNNSENTDGTKSEEDNTVSQSENTDTQSEEKMEEQTGTDTPGEKSESDQGDSGVRQTRSMRTILKSIRGIAVPEGEPIPSDAITGVKRPCILIFDSLSGPSRNRIVTVLKEYLQVEWAVKKGGTELSKASIRGCVPKVPQQTNFSDCGVYMLQYVESFFEDPIQDFSTPIRGLMDWFTTEKIEGKREELRDLIIDLKEKYESNTGGKENNT